MRRVSTTLLTMSVILIFSGMCRADDRDADANSKGMWTDYVKMWKGEWSATFTMPGDFEDEEEFREGKKISCAMTVKQILRGNGLLITRTFRNAENEIVLGQKSLASWCPKQKAIVLHELSTMGGHAEGIIKMVDGQEHHTSTRIDAQGRETVGRSTATVINENANQIKVTDGPLAGFELTWKRKG